MRVTSDGVYLRGFGPGQHSSEETSQRWRGIGDTVSDFIDPGIEPKTSRTDSDVLTTELTGRCFLKNEARYRSYNQIIFVLCSK